MTFDANFSVDIQNNALKIANSNKTERERCSFSLFIRLQEIFIRYVCIYRCRYIGNGKIIFKHTQHCLKSCMYQF